MTQDPKTSEKLLQATRQALNTASFRANQYKQVVQKKIDLGAIQRKIEQLGDPYLRLEMLAAADHEDS